MSSGGDGHRQGAALAVPAAGTPAPHYVRLRSAGSGSHLLKLFLVPFDAGAFRDEWFDAAGIACPPAIARSVHKRKAEFFFGRLCSRSALSDLGLPDTPIPSGAFREPVWPPGVIGSISHHGGQAAAIVLAKGAQRGVGIDLERVVGPDALAALLATVLSKTELAYLSALAARTGTSLHLLVTLVFSAKESFFKAAFGDVGRYFDFYAIEVISVELELETVLVSVCEDLGQHLVPGERYEIAFNMLGPDTVLTALLR